ncbi:MAG TPA: ornithine cyclodeaminase family protein [Bryobacteraceae bacterium]|nr:ornithine cyclodeaminase family protein [Bryobacteraceae bacterium]
MALILAESEVRALVAVADLVDVMERALASFSSGQVTQPVRASVDTHHAFFGVMPAYVGAPPALGAKLVTVFSTNGAKGLPALYASIVLLDPETGALAAIMDGRYITAARTAAVSAVAVRHLSPSDAQVLAILGSGVQARSHVEALSRIRSCLEIRAWSPTPEHLARFVSDAHALAEPPVHAAATAEKTVRDADVIVLATSSSIPVLQSDWVSPGALVISLGAYQPHMREMDPALTARARVIVDSRAAALVEAGDIVQGIREGLFTQAHIAGELGEVVLGRVPGRCAEHEVLIFKSLGMAVEDVAAAQLAYTRAVERRIGREISL